MSVFRTTVLLAEALLLGSVLAAVESCAEAKAVVPDSGRIDQVHVGFALDLEGRVGPGCDARTFSLHDPIHLSLQVLDAPAGSVVHVSVRNVVTHEVAWSEARPVAQGGSSQTFEIGTRLAVGRYRAESTLGGAPTTSTGFLVHDRRPGVR